MKIQYKGGWSTYTSSLVREAWSHMERRYGNSGGERPVNDASVGKITGGRCVEEIAFVVVVWYCLSVEIVKIGAVCID
jgi:hypothetical protein